MTKPPRNESASKGWDPLEGDLPSEIVSATIKRQIKNILKSYTGWFDPFAELIQNALDALEHRTAEKHQFEPTLWVEINLKDNTLSVTDNGLGFLEDQFRSFLAPNVSFKPQTDRGNKGVGATYLAYGFNFLHVATKTPDFNYIGTIKSGREWVEDEKGIKTRPKILPDTKCFHEAFDSIDRGSSFTLKLVGDFIRPKKLNWMGATNAEQWQALLRIQTPLGGVYESTHRPLKNWHLKVTDEAGNITQLTSTDCEYLYPHRVISTCERQQAIIDAQLQLLKQGKDASRLPDKFFNLNGLYNLWSATDFTEKDKPFTAKLDATQIDLVTRRRNKVTCHAGLCAGLPYGHKIVITTPKSTHISECKIPQ